MPFCSKKRSFHSFKIQISIIKKENGSKAMYKCATIIYNTHR